MSKAQRLELNEEEKEQLEQILRSKTVAVQIHTRARILSYKSEGKSTDKIAQEIGVNRKSVLLCLKKYKDGGIENALHDAPGRGRNPEITDEEKTWIIDVACQSPMSCGYAAETWTYAKLTEHINKSAGEAGYPSQVRICV